MMIWDLMEFVVEWRALLYKFGFEAGGCMKGD